MFEAERRTKLVFSLSEAYSSLLTKNDKGVGREPKHLNSVVTGMDVTAHTAHVDTAVDSGTEK